MLNINILKPVHFSGLSLVSCSALGFFFLRVFKVVFSSLLRIFSKSDLPYEILCMLVVDTKRCWYYLVSELLGTMLGRKQHLYQQ